MPLLDIFRAVRDQTRDEQHSLRANTDKLGWRFAEVFARCWDLGFTILHHRFVDGVGGKNKWIDEQTYQELFAICQALPGPGSTKMLFSVVWIRAGLLPAIFAFLLWSLPGAIAMYGLSLGIQKIPDTLPSTVYALLSGMNASTVGIIALAAVQLADKAIKDKLSRILVIFGACAGLCYTALWYFPLLIIVGGIATLVWDLWLQQKVGKLRTKLKRRKNIESAEESQPTATAIPERQETPIGLQRRTQAGASKERASGEHTEAGPSNIQATVQQSGRDDGSGVSDSTPTADTITHSIGVKIGISIIVFFFVTFIPIMVLRGTLSARTLAFDLFANMYLAGTIIFGGGPVVIPLLREYVVQPGWVSPRDFLIGLAIIQAFPGPNFNFGVYLGALAFASTGTPTVLGALLGYIGMFTPGLTLAVGAQALWRVLRTKSSVISVLRGINATAVGLVFTAVYRLWEIGYLTPETSDGNSLAKEPWWVVVAALTYAESAWFDVPPALAIVIGAVLGLVWYGVVSG